MCAKEQCTQDRNGQHCSLGFFSQLFKEGLSNHVTNSVFEMSKGGANWGENFPALVAPWSYAHHLYLRRKLERMGLGERSKHQVQHTENNTTDQNGDLVFLSRWFRTMGGGVSTLHKVLSCTSGICGCIFSNLRSSRSFRSFRSHSIQAGRTPRRSSAGGCSYMVSLGPQRQDREWRI